MLSLPAVLVLVPNQSHTDMLELPVLLIITITVAPISVWCGVVH